MAPRRGSKGGEERLQRARSPTEPSSTQDISTEGVWLGVNYHFTPGRRADVFAGGFAGLSYFGDVTVVSPAGGLLEKLAFDDDLGFGLRAGVDVSLGQRRKWFASVGARYLSTILEGESGGDLDLDPLLLSIGFGHRF